ncbi:MAG: hypothetical protein EBS79_07915, partial [Gammaproteobacteria bacterium]|nr:hypothetical protein [Gammaproteobacteria bacterium]
TIVRAGITTGLVMCGGMANSKQPEFHRMNPGSYFGEKIQAKSHPPAAPHKTRKQSFKRKPHKAQSLQNIEPSQSIDAQKEPSKSVSAGNAGPKKFPKKADTDYKATSGEEVMGLQMLGEIEIKGRTNDLQGIASSASQGQVSNDDFKYRPVARPGELIEVVPGMISTQHSGTGKANQYFLRGFNLDHGTDFTTWIDGVPMNLRSNAHGQGYMDLNSLIPELVDTIEYGKGPYYADQGDFSSAGYARMLTKNKMTGFNNDGAGGYAKFEGGMFDYYRGLIADSKRIGDGDLLYAFEYTGFMGPWVVPENSNKYNGMLKYAFDLDEWKVSVNAKSYYSHWVATNQIPMMMLGQSLTPTCCNIPGSDGVGSDGRFGSMNPSDGGVTSRYSGSVNAKTSDKDSATELNAYALYYDLNLFSDFTYFSANPSLGDQVHQQEHRVQAGGNAEHTWYHVLEGFDMEDKLGMQLRYDGIRNLGVSNTYQRMPVFNNNQGSPTTRPIQAQRQPLC